MEQYKRKTDEIHAPEALINATINRIHEEEKLQEITGANSKADTRENTTVIRKPGRWAAVSSLAVAAAAVVLVVGLSRVNSPEMNLIYNTVPETLVRTMDGEQVENNMDVEEYSDYLGLDIQNITENAMLVKAEICVEQENGIVTEDKGTVIYNVDGEQMMILFSKTVEVVPEHLAGGEISDVNGQQVLAAVSENSKEHMAAVEYNGITCFLMSYSMEQQEFEAFLLAFLDNFENK